MSTIVKCLLKDFYMSLYTQRGFRLPFSKDKKVPCLVVQFSNEQAKESLTVKKKVWVLVLNYVLLSSPDVDHGSGSFPRYLRVLYILNSFFLNVL